MNDMDAVLRRYIENKPPTNPVEEAYGDISAAAHNGELNELFEKESRAFKKNNQERKDYLIYAINILPVYVENEKIPEKFTLDFLFKHILAKWQKLEKNRRAGIKNTQDINEKGLQKITNALHELVKEGGHEKDGLNLIITLLGRKLEETEKMLSDKNFDVPQSE